MNVCKNLSEMFVRFGQTNTETQIKCVYSKSVPNSKYSSSTTNLDKNNIRIRNSIRTALVSSYLRIIIITVFMKMNEST